MKTLFVSKKNLFCIALAAYLSIYPVFIPGKTNHLNAAEDSLKLLSEMSEAFAQVSEMVKPAVVNLTVASIYEQRMPDYEFFFGDPFDFFGDDFWGQGQRSRPRSRVQKRRVEGSGSGVIINEEGYILTNHHVVKDADEIKIALGGDKEHNYTGKVVGIDERTDLAVVKIVSKGQKFHFAKLGDSDKTAVGHWVLAIGAPFGLEQTVTSGIISAKRQQVDIGEKRFKHMLQTDASINMGNSGGPLVNLKGEVIGINTAIWAPTGVFNGIGFAIPINMAKEILKDLIERGKVSRGWLGIEIRRIDEAVMQGLGLKDKCGALVNNIVSGSPAEKSGLKRGDVICAVNGESINDDFDLQTKIGSLSPGSKAELKVIRQGVERIIDVTLGEMSSKYPAISSDEEKKQPEAKKQERGKEERWQGLVLSNLDEKTRAYLNIAQDVSGVVVKEVEPDSRFSGTLLEGDCIVGINSALTPSLREFIKAAGKITEKDSMLLDIVRGGKSVYVSVSGTR